MRKSFKIAIILFVLFPFILTGIPLWAIPPEEIVTTESLSSQSVKDEDTASPYMISGESLVKLIERLVKFDTPGASIVFNRRAGRLLVRNIPGNQALVEKILNSLREVTFRQVEIEARIITVTSDDFEGLGLDLGVFDLLHHEDDNFWGTDLSGGRASPTALGQGATNTFIEFPNIADGSSTTAGQFSFAALTKSFDLRSYIDALKSKGEVNTLSAPKIAVFNNQRANIKITTATYYVRELSSESTQAAAALTLDTKIGIAESGTILDVTPTINTNDTISLELHPHYVRVDLSSTQTITPASTNELAQASQPFVTLPVFTSQAVDTTVTVENGGTAVLGGLITEVENKNTRKVPFLGDLPLIGFIFKNTQIREQKSHLLIFIKATIKNPKESYIE